MSIDIYAHYRGQPQEEITRQIREFLSGTTGNNGHLWEADHGEPSVTRFLVPEAFVNGAAKIPAATLRQRLAEAVRLAKEREREVYGTTDAGKIQAVTNDYINFVMFCERAEYRTGEPVMIIASY
jgi:hypothetical protein